jgi:phospholipase C
MPDAMHKELPHPLIKHVVVLMLENRGFDHLMGWLYQQGETPHIVTAAGDDQPFIGLSSLSGEQLAGLANAMPNNRGTLPINCGARSPKTPSYNPGESFQHIMNQTWGVDEPAATWFDRAARLRFLATQPAVPPMNGYVLDYDEETFEETSPKRHLGREDLSEILDTYTPEQVPVLSGLARSYGVSDSWFCSVPSQTNTNRAFSITGTSRGLVNNSFYDPPSWNPIVALAKLFIKDLKGTSQADALPVSTRSLFEVLEQANYSWKLFWQSEWPPKAMTAGQEWQYTRTMVPLLGNEQFNPNFVKFDASDPLNAFFNACRGGELPAVSWIEPKWGGGKRWAYKGRGVGNDMHPVSDTTVAEDFVMDLYLALSQSAKWPQTLLVITFDENGGTYDHVPPPAAPASGTDACPLPHPPIDRHDMNEETRTQYGFDFQQYGVRVPTLLVSPCIPANTIFRSTGEQPYDHTSLIATVLKLAAIDPSKWLLGDRVATAPTFEGVLANPAVRDIGSTLGVPFERSHAEALAYNTGYYLQYVGDIWRAQPGVQYLSALTSGRLGYYKYPTLTSDQAQALKFWLVPRGGGDGTGLVLNMSDLMIRTIEPGVLQTPYLTVSWDNPVVYYDSNKGAPSLWQIRILGSRNARAEVRADDYVYFVSQLPPPAYAVAEQMQPDPYQRLIPHPEQDNYVTTKAGEWALWQLTPALGDDDD